jgi:hypothetical protein
MHEEIDKMINMFKSCDEEYSYKKICEYTTEQKIKYSELLSELKKTNSSKCSTQEKGKALEDIATFVLYTGGMFDVYQNIRTSTNELDQLVKANCKGKILCASGIIDNRFKNFIGECKNYKDKVSVTYVGKVCSLLSTTQNKMCILFSYNGITGSSWEEASGLARKFYLSKENVDDRFCIIDFNINDFEDIDKGNNFLQIIEEKIIALQNDTDYLKLSSTHELSEKILELQEL